MLNFDNPKPFYQPPQRKISTSIPENNHFHFKAPHFGNLGHENGDQTLFSGVQAKRVAKRPSTAILKRKLANRKFLDSHPGTGLRPYGPGTVWASIESPYDNVPRRSNRTRLSASTGNRLLKQKSESPTKPPPIWDIKQDSRLSDDSTIRANRLGGERKSPSPTKPPPIWDIPKAKGEIIDRSRATTVERTPSLEKSESPSSFLPGESRVSSLFPATPEPSGNEAIAFKKQTHKSSLFHQGSVSPFAIAVD